MGSWDLAVVAVGEEAGHRGGAEEGEVAVEGHVVLVHDQRQQHRRVSCQRQLLVQADRLLRPCGRAGLITAIGEAGWSAKFKLGSRMPCGRRIGALGTLQVTVNQA